MKLEDAKKELVVYKDAYGQPLLDWQDIDNCKSIQELSNIIEAHNDHIKSAYLEASGSLSRLRYIINEP